MKKRSRERALWIGGSAVAAAGLVTAAVLLTKKSSAAPANTSVTATGPTNTTTTTTTATGPQPPPNGCPPDTAWNGTNCASTMTPPPPAIPAIPFVGQTQSQLVTAPNTTYAARAVQGGAMQLTMPSSILSVSPDASYTSQQTSGNTVNFVLSGQPGTIVIKWGTGATTVVVQLPGFTTTQATAQ